VNGFLNRVSQVRFLPGALDPAKMGIAVSSGSTEHMPFYLPRLMAWRTKFESGRQNQMMPKV
jgi:hypothetical protein